MKKLLILGIMILVLFVGCRAEEPVLPEAMEEPESVKTVTCKQAVLDIAELLGQDEAAEDYAAYVEQHGFTAYMDDVGWDDPISYRDAAALLYAAAEHHPDRLPMAVVTEAHPKIDGMDDDSVRYILFLYRWGILYGDAPEDWYADISPEKFSEMLLRVETPELRLELLPDILTQLSWKLDAAYPCACMEEHTEEEMQTAKDGMYPMLAEWEGLQRALECSYWILEKNDGIFYLHMFTGIEDGTVSYTQCTYDPATEQGRILDSRAPENWDMYDPGAEIIYSVCMADEQKDELEDGLVAFYLNIADENFWKFSPLYEGYTVAYATPRWNQPVLTLMAMHEDALLTHTFFSRGNLGMYIVDPMADSWQQVHSDDFSVRVDALRTTTDEARVEQLRQKAMSATFCTCMAREYAQWRVYRDPDTVTTVRTAFADYLIENRKILLKECFDLLTDTYWIIDRDTEGIYYLQVIGKKGEYEKEAEQRVLLAYDGSAVTVHEKARQLSGLVPAICADSCDEEHVKAAEAQFESVYDGYIKGNSLFWRLSAMEDGGCVLAMFEKKQDSLSKRIVEHYPDGRSDLIGAPGYDGLENAPESIAAMMDRVLAMDFGVLELGEDEVFLLDYLKVSLTDVDELGRWNLPAATCDSTVNFWGMRTTIKQFLEELELDPALKERFMEMDHWTLNKMEGFPYYVSGIDAAGNIVKVLPEEYQVIDAQTWTEPFRPRLQELAAAGENSELVPEELREQFVTYALRETWNAKRMSGEYGSAQWFWSITESGNVMLEVRSVNEEEKEHINSYQYDAIILAEADGTVFRLDLISGGSAGAPDGETVDMEVETVSYVRAIEDISALIGADPQTFADYAEEDGVCAPGAYQLGWDGPISYAVAWELVCRAVQCDPDYLYMTVVDKDPSGYETSSTYDPVQDDVYNLYTWGVLYGDAPKNWFAEIPAEEFDELLLRAGSPELRLELLPDKLTLLSWKLDEVSYCSCIQTNTRPKVNLAKEGLIAVLSDWEGLDRALECSYWIQERKGNVDYLNMFTGMEDGTISFTRCMYDRKTGQGEILETRTLEPYDLYGSETDILRCVCMTDEQKERLDQEFLEQYLTSFRGYAEESYCIPFFEGYTVAYAWPLWEEPAVMLIALHEGKLRSQTIVWRDDDWREDKILWYSDVLSHSWYHIYSNTYYTGW